VTTYELRTVSGRPFMAFDDRTRAEQFRAAHLKRTKVNLRLFEVRRVEQELIDVPA
jgi:hypothetical protein